MNGKIKGKKSTYKHLYKSYIRGESRSLITIKSFDLNNYIEKLRT